MCDGLCPYLFVWLSVLLLVQLSVQLSVCRQGDPGSTRYFLSLEDNLFRIFGGDRIKTLMTTFGVADLPIESKMLTNSLSEAQRKVNKTVC